MGRHAGMFADKYKVDKYLSNTYYVLDTAQEYFETSKDHFFTAVLQKTTAQTDHPGKCQPKEGGYFNQRHED